MTESSPRRIRLPGFGLPLDWMPKRKHDGELTCFPHAIVDFYASDGVTLREQRMLDFITKITDKPEWERKVFDDDILKKWKAEAVVWRKELASQYSDGDLYLSMEMWEFCVSELQEKAKIYKESGIINVMDAEATVVKSDVMIAEETRQALLENVRPLENVPDRIKDWHPGSGEQVLDLVHPSLFPLSYGRSRILPGGTVPLHTCSEYIGCGEIAKYPKSDPNDNFKKGQSWGNDTSLKPWGRYQWLPANIAFTDNNEVKITSYINNLHPQRHQNLYHVLEQVTAKAIPLWDEVLSKFHNRIRIPIDYSSHEDDFFYTEEYVIPEEDKPEDSDDENYKYTNAYWDWEQAHRILIQREPREFIQASEFTDCEGYEPIDLREKFKDSGLQIIYKLANIHLTPEDPVYDGSNWHVEGALNEHICATAIYYYDSDNIEDTHIEFRQAIDAEQMIMKPAQSEYHAIEAYYGIQNEDAAIQDLGSVLTRQGRLLAFPNVLQHQVQPFGLADRTRPGHRKILAMFLVDPHVPILSTANVPPQRRDWWADEVRKVPAFEGLPEEIFEMIIEAVHDFPIKWEDALGLRMKLMEERGRINDDIEMAMKQDTFYFCEH